jgi:1,2-dihydroxy-3-keto-5-methylthiopentene dioxygenase
MALVRIPQESRTLTDPQEIVRYLGTIGIDYEHWEPAHPVAANAPPEEILAAYSQEIERLKSLGGYVSADVIDVKPETPGLDAMLAKFNREHWHDEDEVRFIIQGRGLFHIHPRQGAVIAVEVEPGDLLRVPRGTWHWFDLCADREIRAIRLFQSTTGWTPRYTESGVDKDYQPVCLGPHYLPSRAILHRRDTQRG